MSSNLRRIECKQQPWTDEGERHLYATAQRLIELGRRVTLWRSDSGELLMEERKLHRQRDYSKG